MRFDLLSLKLFVTVCEQQSISRTAELEHIAVSAVSKRISDLELAVQTPLFTRGQKSLEMTSAAHDLLRHARAVVRDLTELESEMLDHAEGRRGEVRVSASHSTIVQHLPADLSAFLRLHPAIRVGIDEALSRDVIQSVSDNSADIGIFGGSVPAPGLHVVSYRSDRLVVLMPKDHVLIGATSLSFGEIVAHDIVGPSHGSCLDVLLMRASTDLGQPLRLPIRVHGFEAASKMVEVKLGIALVPERQAIRYAVGGALTWLPLDEVWAVRQWHICTRDPVSLTASAKLLLQHLRMRTQVSDRRGYPLVATAVPLSRIPTAAARS